MSKLPHILVVEDDRDISALVARYLRANECRVTLAGHGRDADRVMAGGRIDLIVLDLMLPGEDGLWLCRRLRDSGSQVPIIMLTAKGDEVDRILGLEMGADDYLAKPFNPRELLARIRAVLRRIDNRRRNPAATAAACSSSRAGGSTGCCASRQPCRRPRRSHRGRVRPAAAFCERPGRVLSREQLLDLTQGRSSALSTAASNPVSRLRRKIEADPHQPSIIKTVRSGGYLFTSTVEPA